MNSCCTRSGRFRLYCPPSPPRKQMPWGVSLVGRGLLFVSRLGLPSESLLIPRLRVYSCAWGRRVTENVFHPNKPLASGEEGGPRTRGRSLRPWGWARAGEPGCRVRNPQPGKGRRRRGELQQEQGSQVEQMRGQIEVRRCNTKGTCGKTGSWR